MPANEEEEEEEDRILKRTLGWYWLAFDLLCGGIAFMGLFTSDLDVPIKVLLAVSILLIAGLIDLHAMEAANARDTYHNETIIALQALESRIAGNDTAAISDSLEQYRKVRVFDNIATGDGILEVVLHFTKLAAWPLIGWVAASWLWPLLNH